jgi:hypothetical protein
MITPGMQNTDPINSPSPHQCRRFSLPAPGRDSQVRHVGRHRHHPVGTSTERRVDAKLLLPQHFPGPRQFRQAPVTDQPAGGVTERLACGWPPKLEIIQGGA